LAEPSAAQSAGGDRFRAGADVVSRRLDDQTVLVNLRTNRIFELNRTGARFWEMLEEGGSEPEIVTRLVAEFDASEDQITSEVRSLIDSLLQEELIVRESQAT
jgi:hypothetical protein